jgi:PST family polysaccharide transporter
MLFWVTQLTIPISVVLALVAPELIQCLLGERWLGSATMMRILVIYAIARSIQDDMINLFMALGHVRVILRVQWLEAFMMIGGGAAAGWAFGALGICWAVNAMMLVGLVVLVPLLRRFVDLQLLEIFGAALASSGIAAIVSGWLVPADWFGGHPWGQLLGKTLTFLIVYGITQVGLNRRRLAAKWTLLLQLWKGG